MADRFKRELLGNEVDGESARPAKALEMFRELVSSLGAESGIVSSDGKPIDLDIFTMLMDGYCRAQDPVGVMEIQSLTGLIVDCPRYCLHSPTQKTTKLLHITRNAFRSSRSVCSVHIPAGIDRPRHGKACSRQLKHPKLLQIARKAFRSSRSVSSVHTPAGR
ncbi:hypothetical protein PtB15_9B471 [Puccinia triticina]|nr:hypothetical protein PtB15_9B471 [Puccinia triticina]